jgi:hypothetical protein
MPDLLERIRKELNARIRELQPVVREFERLDRAAEAIGRAGARRVPAMRSRAGSSPAERAAAAPVRGKGNLRSAATKPAPHQPSPAPGRAGSPRKPAPRGQTQAKVLEALGAAPGSGPSAVAQASGVSTAVAAATLSRLVKQGLVRRIEAGRYAVVDATDGRSAAAPAADTRPAEKTAAAQGTQAPPPTNPG